jgi:ferric-chelate reductase (NADPH)
MSWTARCGERNVQSMTPTNPEPSGPPRKPAGMLESAVLKLFTRGGHVLDIEDVGAAFRLVTIGGDALRNAAWTPGDKVQLQLGGWTQRTYTPIDWDAEAGRMRVLIHLHADGPGTQWARALGKGDACLVFGPRKSLDLTRLSAGAVLFGDETSFGLAAALLGAVRPSSAHLFFEVASPVAAEPALTKFGLNGAHLCVREVNDTHLAALEEPLLAALQAEPTANIVLSGKASSIQHMSKLLKRFKVASGRCQVRAYWATGKTGLD